MRAVVVGQVVDVKDSSWTGNDGNLRPGTDVYVRQEGSSLAYGADRLSWMPDVPVPSIGDEVAVTVAFKAAVYKSGGRAGEAYLKGYAVGCKTLVA